MKLPHGERAIVDMEKLRGYCLSQQHVLGQHKARVFASVGIQLRDAEELRTCLLAAALRGEAVPGVANEYGQRYIVDFNVFRRGRAVLAYGVHGSCG